MWQVKWVVLWSLWAAGLVRQPTAPVRTSSGWVRGAVGSSGTHNAYLGIPYATVVKRFQAPGPEPSWDGIFEAVDEHVRCRQHIYLNAAFATGQEDCLVLNVYTPLGLPPDKLLPVMVFIHGGGFFENSGSRSLYGPEFLVTKDVILVTFNYRLSVQGFGCLGIKEAPGNAGMKDQVAALKWVQRNIRAFGGDPDNVTIFGESAGAVSASYHVISPMSKGLFHKAIAQSGSSICPWGLQYKPVYMASLLAKAMGFESMDPKALYEFFMTKTDSDLVLNRVPRQVGNTIGSEIVFTPCVETRIEGEEPFLTELPYDLLSKGQYYKVPMIIGSNSEEGLLFISMEEKSVIEKAQLDKMLPKDISFPSNEIRRLAAQEIKKMYFGNEDVGLKTKLNLSKIYGESYLNYPAMEEVELMVKTSDQPVYSYYFAYDGFRNIPKLTSDTRWAAGATHADDLFYLFNQPFMPTRFGKKIVDEMSTMWTNFAKYGNPTPVKTDLLPVKWPAVTTEDMRSLLIDHELTTIPLWHLDTLRYWKSLYSNYRRKL